MLCSTSMSPARSLVLRTSSRSTSLSRLIASRFMPCFLRSSSSAGVLPMKVEVGGITASEMPARLGLNRSPNSRSRELSLRKLFCAKSSAAWRAPIAPITLPTQIRLSAGGASRDSLPVLSASSSGAPCSASASPIDMPTKGLSAVTVSSNTSPSMP